MSNTAANLLNNRSIDDCLSDVAQFHERVASPVALSPRTLPCDRASAALFAARFSDLAKELAEIAYGDVLLKRASFAIEELGEWFTAHAEGDLVGVADAIGDRLYVLLGDAVATGMPLTAIFQEVHRSNMTKCRKTESSDGKGAKRSRYLAPNIAGLLPAQRETSLT